MAYEYDHDCPFEAFITNLGKYNEGELVGEWVKFPTTSEELQKVFERIGIGSKDDFGNPYEEWFISDYDCYVDGLYEKLGEYENLDELNYLASKLDELDDHDYNHFQAAMQISDYTGSIKDVINLIDNLDKYEIYPGVESNADLGHYYIEELGMMEVPDYLADYIDYEAYGRDVAINEMGQFTDYGYVRDTQESFTEYYDGDRENIPDEYRVMDFMVSGEKERKTMNYETFKQEFAEDIKEKLYERGYDDVRISFNNVEKTNQNYEAMSVVPEGNNVGVNFNIENAFASYEHTDDYAGVLASATMVIADGLDRAPAIDVSALMDYENMKEKLSVEVISADANADLLANVPHDRMEDLAVVYRFVMESSEDGRASILVTNNLMDRMGVSHEQLRSDALENSPEIRPVVIMGMNEVMKEMMGPEVYEMFGIPDDAEETMYVATVPDKNSGAGVIAYQEFMDQAAERVGGDFFVLPSSINEILLVPDNGDMRHMIHHTGGHMPIAMEESSNYECSESHQSGGFFAVTKERRALMYAKLDKLREDLKKAVAKREAADAKVKQLEAKLKEEENQQIVSDVASYNLSPEQLAQFLQLANSGRLQEMLSGQVPMPGAVNADTSGKKQDEDNETDMDKEEEDFLDEENE